MLLPLALLAVLSLVGGWVGNPEALGGHNEIQHFLDPVFASTAHAEGALNADEVSHGLERGLAAISILVALFGFGIAYLFYYRKPGTLGARFSNSAIYKVVANKFYVDELYDIVFVKGTQVLTRVFLAGIVDTGIVGGFGYLAAQTTRGASALTRRIQSGNIRSYAGWLAAGAAIVLIALTASVFGLHLSVR